jgi:SAM-dependent methyltransferase
MSLCPICEASLPAPSIASTDRLHGCSGRFALAVCGACGAGRTFPAATLVEQAAYYPTAYGPYAAAPNPLVGAVSHVIRRFQGWRARRTQPLSALRGLPPGRGVDVGAGRGDVAALLSRSGWRMTAVEPSAQACALMRGRGVDAREGVLATVELEPASYDVAIFQHSLEHVDDPVEDLRCAAAALRPGGRVLVTVPHFGSWQARRFGARWFHLDLPRHRVHFTREALVRALERAGFTVEGTGTSTTAVGLPASVQYRLAGRCLFPGGLGLQVAAGLCVLALPLAWLLDRAGGGGDQLHAIARRVAD